MTGPRVCGKRDARGALACDRPAKHKGQHAASVDSERVYWGRPSGPSGTRRAARSPGSGLRRVEAYLTPEAAAAHDRLKAVLGSTKAALEWALTQAPAPR